MRLSKVKYLLTPGPTPLPNYVREALSKEMIHHRTEEFRDILEQVHKDLKKIFYTDYPVLVICSSGTGAMETAVVNFFSSQDKVIVIRGGKFGQRWAEICLGYGLEVISIDVEWGNAPDPTEIDRVLKKEKNIKGVLTTLCETSTATVYDIENIAKVTKPTKAILVVDAISGLGQDRLLTDVWGVDVVVGGSQKGLMLPPGLAFISINDKARKLMDNSNLPKYYFDLRKALKSFDKNDTPFTPNVTLVRALKESLDIINKEGIEKRWERFKRLAYATREAAQSIGLKVFSKRPSSSVTALFSPEGLLSSAFIKELRQKNGLALAGGQDILKDKIIRIAHMGAINEDDLIFAFSILERSLKERGYPVKLGTSLSRFQEVYYESSHC